MCAADLAAVNFGCLPPVGSPYVGSFRIDIALGVGALVLATVGAGRRRGRG